MAAPQEFAAQFSRTLELFRDPAAKEEQKAQFRALASLLKSEGAIILAQDGRITVNGAPVNGNTLLQRLDLHSIHEITIPADPPLAELFELLRGLAEQAGEEDLATRLRGSAKRIGVTMHSFSFDAPAPVGRTDVPGPPPPAAADEVPEIVRESVAGHAAFSPAAAASQSHHQIIAQLQEKPDGPAVGDLLAVLGRQLEAAMKGRRGNPAVGTLAGLVAPGGAGGRGHAAAPILDRPQADVQQGTARGRGGSREPSLRSRSVAARVAQGGRGRRRSVARSARRRPDGRGAAGHLRRADRYEGRD